ncbi:hypothetical protein DKP76_07265 [Falsochrobactrum shanghaiense]|uniref:Uncharacterized protein n=1 Tax=Falsochrobactrum shanghaiense TaxID=2201899 RepID=A0A316JHZ1_9HYPH|nr:hypothetical protein [Falsochrobactrum shanghaiense]PWL18853.1 hypothetical protein DKP76_07265 [Falsochrobactrum shanghaiense]
MTLSEFKAWLEGFSTSFIDGAPDAEQWAAIASKLDRVIAEKISQPPQTFPPIGKPWFGDLPPMRTWYSH